jgi:hypothetical protein
MTRSHDPRSYSSSGHDQQCRRTKNAVRAEKPGSPGATRNSRRAVNSPARNAHIFSDGAACTTQLMPPPRHQNPARSGASMGTDAGCNALNSDSAYSSRAAWHAAPPDIGNPSTELSASVTSQVRSRCCGVFRATRMSERITPEAPGARRAQVASSNRCIGSMRALWDVRMSIKVPSTLIRSSSARVRTAPITPCRG